MSENIREFLKRSVFSCIFIFLVALFIFYSELFFVKPILAAMCGIFSFFAAKEFIVLAEWKGIRLAKWVLLASSIILAAAFYLREEFVFFRNLPLFIFSFFTIAAFMTTFNKIDGALVRVGTSFFGFFYAVLPIFLLYDILYMPSGPLMLIYLLVVTKSSDFLAYIGGKLFGRSKLAATLSPAKTKEGAIFGFFASLFVSLLFFFALGWFWAVFFGVLFGILSQIGDLSESLLKRDSSIKHSSSLPGLGGVLDIMDSLFFNTYLFYFFLVR